MLGRARSSCRRFASCATRGRTSPRSSFHPTGRSLPLRPTTTAYTSTRFRTRSRCSRNSTNTIRESRTSTFRRTAATSRPTAAHTSGWHARRPTDARSSANRRSSSPSSGRRRLVWLMRRFVEFGQRVPIVQMSPVSTGSRGTMSMRRRCLQCQMTTAACGSSATPVPRRTGITIMSTSAIQRAYRQSVGVVAKMTITWQRRQRSRPRPKARAKRWSMILMRRRRYYSTFTQRVRVTDAYSSGSTRAKPCRTTSTSRSQGRQRKRASSARRTARRAIRVRTLCWLARSASTRGATSLWPLSRGLAPSRSRPSCRRLTETRR
mmetsp:Transcript_12407/g.33741  ORF Transcript_12407/g.33741 Transcript_12407/m.33741 type:complete len:321 (+) Transcript_12407:2739-3701(+)